MRAGFVFVGRLTAGKGLETAIRAVAWLDRDDDSALRIVGEGPLQTSMLRLVTDLQLNSRCSFSGYQQDTSPFFRSALACIMPSTELEGCPYTALEALAHGCPVIASDLPVFDPLVVHGVTGLRFRRGDAADLAAQMRVLIDNPGLASELGENGRRLVQEHYTLDDMIRNTLAVYERALTGTEGR